MTIILVGERVSERQRAMQLRAGKPGSLKVDPIDRQWALREERQDLANARRLTVWAGKRWALEWGLS